jgi:hypothetical protein
MDNLDEHDRISIILVDDFAYRVHGLLPVNEKNEEFIMNSIRNVYFMGGRDIADGVSHGLEVLKQRNYKNPLSLLYLIAQGVET